MERLHSYWRMEYVEALKYPEGENPFVALPRANDDRAAHIVHRSAHSYLMLNRFPYNAGHLLAVPFKEVAEIGDLNREERADLLDEILLAQELLKETLQPDGFNIGFNLGQAAGASITQHLHCHVVPRWSGDTNFMPVIGDVRILPKSLDSMWQALRAACDAHLS